MDSVEIEILPEEVAAAPVLEASKPWYEQSYWKAKGEPQERVVLNFADSKTTVVNFNKDIQFEKYRERATQAMKDFGAKFPNALAKLKWILIRDFQGEPIYEGFQVNGITLQRTAEGTMVLEPRAFGDIPHRIARVQNFEGTLAHELGHQVDTEFFDEWRKFWPDVFNEQDNWILDKRKGVPFTELNPPTHKVTGQVATTESQYLADPQQCVTEYAKTKPVEDICESLVAYMYDPELFEAKSPEKFELIRTHDVSIKPATVELK